MVLLFDDFGSCVLVSGIADGADRKFGGGGGRAIPVLELLAPSLSVVALDVGKEDVFNVFDVYDDFVDDFEFVIVFEFVDERAAVFDDVACESIY